MIVCEARDVFMFMCFSILFFKLGKYDDTFTEDLDDTEQSYIYFYILQFFKEIKIFSWNFNIKLSKINRMDRKVEGYMDLKSTMINSA